MFKQLLKLLNNISDFDELLALFIETEDQTTLIKTLENINVQY